MVLPIVHYGHPVLRQKGDKILKVTSEILTLAQNMIETMHSARGVGLAAQQVGRSLQLTVLDVRDSDLPSQLILGGREIPIGERMPMVLLNPEIIHREGREVGQEGCLSFPQIHANIPRAATIHVTAQTLDLHPLQFVTTGLLGRAIQHELDHLQGILFIDRISEKERKILEPDLKRIERATRLSLIESL